MAFPRPGVVEPHLLGREFFYTVEAAGTGRGAETEPDVLAGASDQLDALHHDRKDGTVAEAAIHRQQQNLFGGAAGIEGGAQPAHQIHETGGEIVSLLDGPILLPFLLQWGEGLGPFPLASLALGEFSTGPFDHRDFLKSDGQGAGADVGPAKQRRQQGSLQEA